MKQRKYTHDYFNRWRDTISKPYIWLQVDYFTETLQPYHFVFEINDERSGSIIWPGANVACHIKFDFMYTDLDFRKGNMYDFSKWHDNLSEISDTRIIPKFKVSEDVSAYEEYVRKAKLNRSSCLDIDVIEINKNSIVGIEGTHLKVEMSNDQKALRLFGSILDKRLFLENAHQLIVQYNTLNMLGISFYFLVFNIKNEKLMVEGNSLLIKVDAEFIEALKRKDKQECLRRAVFGSFKQNYNKMIEEG